MLAALSALYRARGGNFAVTFAIMSTILVAVAGLAIDYANLSMRRSKMQSAADAAALAAARDPASTQAQRTELAIAIFKANAGGMLPDTFDVTFPGNQVKVEARTKVQNMLGSFLHADTSDIAVASYATAGPPQTVEIAFVLDVSGSMANSLTGSPDRITALKQSVGSLLTKLKTTASSTGLTVKAAVVPFTMAVNVGMNNTSFVNNRNNALFTGTKWRGCVFERPSPNTFADSSSGGNWWAYIWPPMPNVYATGDYMPFGTRGNGTNAGYSQITETDSSFDPWASGPNYNCVRYPIFPLTSDLDAVNSEIQKYQAYVNMGTIIAAGVSWGMRVLSPDAPFTEGAPYGSNVRKIMIVVTDGEQVTEAEAGGPGSKYDGNGVHNQSSNSNKATPWSFNPAAFGLEGTAINNGFGPKDYMGPYGFLRDSQPLGTGYVNNEAPTSWTNHLDQIVKVSSGACAEAKKQTNGRRIEIFTLGVSTDTQPGTRIYNQLHDCASAPGNHYYVSDTVSLANALEKMLVKADVLRLTQ